jgi:hypothetical protein
VILSLGCVDSPVPAAEWADLPDAVVGEEYSVQLEITAEPGRIEGVTWHNPDYAPLPSFLSLDTVTGILTGTPNEPGTLRIAIEARAVADGTIIDGRELQLSVLPGEEAQFVSLLYIKTRSPLSQVDVGQPYTLSLEVENADGDLSWSAEDLPAGLSLDAATGLLAGRPQDTGHFCVPVTVEETGNPSRRDTKILALTVRPAGTTSAGSGDLDSALAAMPCADFAFTAPTTMRLGETREVKLVASLDRTQRQLRRMLVISEALRKTITDLNERGAETGALEAALDSLEGVVSAEIEDTSDTRGAFDSVKTEVRRLEEKGSDVGPVVEELDKISDMVIRGRLLGANVRFSNVMTAVLKGDPGFTVNNLSPERQAVSRLDVTEWRWDITASEPDDQRLTLVLSAVIEVDGSPEPRVLETFATTINVEVSVRDSVVRFHKEYWQFIWSTVLIPLFLWARRPVGNWLRARRGASKED